MGDDSIQTIFSMMNTSSNTATARVPINEDASRVMGLPEQNYEAIQDLKEEIRILNEQVSSLEAKLEIRDQAISSLSARIEALEHGPANPRKY